MKAIIQRVTKASVTVDGSLISSIDKGMLVLIGMHISDTKAKVEPLVNKLLDLRFFADQEDKMNLSIQDIQGEILFVSQFTLYGDCSKGRRPSFTESLPSKEALILYELVIQCLKIKYHPGKIKTGVFGADMQVELINDGPVTLEVII